MPARARLHAWTLVVSGQHPIVARWEYRRTFTLVLGSPTMRAASLQGCSTQQVTIALRKNSNNVTVNRSLRMDEFDNVCSSATKTANHQPILEKSKLFLWRVMGRGSGSISLDPSNGLGRAMRMGDG